MYNKVCNVTMMCGLFGKLHVWMGVLFDDVMAYSRSSSSSSSSSHSSSSKSSSSSNSCSSALHEQTAQNHTKPHNTLHNFN